jgi:hypothetical protein
MKREDERGMRGACVAPLINGMTTCFLKKKKKKKKN